MRKLLVAASLIVSLMAPAVSHAYQKGDFIVRAGMITVNPMDQNNNSAIRHETLGKVAGSHVNAKNATAMGINVVAMFSDHFGLEMLGANPLTSNISLKGMPGPYSSLNGHLGSTRYLPPTLSVVYFPLSDFYRIQPYVGAGLNYTFFFRDKLSNNANSKGFSKVHLSDSVGFAGQIGADYMITDKYLINAQVRWIDIHTHAKLKLAGQKVKTGVDVDPLVYMFSVGYRF